MDEPLWTFEEISAALGVPLPASGGSVSGVSIDSRTLKAGDLFVAIRGERADGHKFVEAAFEKGAAASIVAGDYESKACGVLFRVTDTLDALNTLARASRRRANAHIVAVTGSVGKTGTKEMLRLMLSASGSTHASEKSYNNLWGVPLSLARMPRNTRFGVFEIGMNHAGEITPLTNMVRPHAAIVTWVAPVHIEFFSSAAEIADAKAEIFEGLEQGGAAILPADNEHFERLAKRAREKHAEIVAFGAHAKAGARLLSFEPLANGSRISADILGSNVTFVLGVPGRHLAMNALAALAAVKLPGASVEDAAAALANFEAPEGRGRRQRFETPQGAVLIIDETYNANPASMRAALGVLGAIPRADYARRIAVLGDMLELGNAGPQFHADLASVIDSHDIDLVFCAGPLMAHLYERIPPHKRGGAASTSEELRLALPDALRGGDAVMIKGSLGSRMGLLAEALRAHFANPSADGHSRNAA
ncbi:MAG: UDP-N-acetylmuramoylalanyl-D-glutamyl-2,6-diaminopimelate--D-alanyl-D-alanine ligase [Rhodomicrobium sp.]|nr:UDP-N-acetylmuramoylalanyl-D-glutamyl-2,6-diaminopimelate--D-alanyl-D-alanine ligase [Rhodomicrobium sp.]